MVVFDNIAGDGGIAGENADAGMCGFIQVVVPDLAFINGVVAPVRRELAAFRKRVSRARSALSGLLQSQESS